MNNRSIVMAVVLTSLVGITGSAVAATFGDKVKVNAAGACQGALPQFAGTLRARPLALQNEGASIAFASCSLPTNDENAATRPDLAGVRLVNVGGAAKDVTCTLVNGASNTTNQYLPKTISVPAGGGANIIWNPSELAGSPAVFDQVNWSCSLPESTGLGYVYYYFEHEVGT